MNRDKIARQLMGFDGLNDDFYFDNQADHQSLIRDYLWKTSKILSILREEIKEIELPNSNMVAVILARQTIIEALGG